MNFENRCVMCGDVIPEGRWVCPTCEKKAMREEVKGLQVYLDEGAYPPIRAHRTDAGLDIRAKEKQVIPAKDSAVFHSGIHVRLPKGTAGILISKSGLNVKRDITSTGLIDETYSGEIVIKLYNHGGYDYIVNEGDKISQLVILPVMTPEIDIVPELWEETERGSDGFGSTGR